MIDVPFFEMNPGVLVQKMTPCMEDRGHLTHVLKHLRTVAEQTFKADMNIIFASHPVTNAFLYFSFASEQDGSEMIGSEQTMSVKELLAAPFEQNIFVVPDVDAQPEYQTDFTDAHDIRAFIAVALRIGIDSSPFGILLLAYHHVCDLNSADYELLHFFAQQVSFIAQETWQLHRYREVAHIGKEINDDLSTTEALFSKLSHLISDILDGQHGFLLVVYVAPTHVRDLYLFDEGSVIAQINQPVVGACRYTLDTQKPVFINHWSEEKAHLPFQIWHIAGSAPKESYIFVPLILRGTPLGVLSIQHPQPYAYTQEDMAVLQVLANHTALAINNMRLYHSLNQLNETGQLLVRNIDAESQRPLQMTVEKILAATRADAVVLYCTQPGQSEYSDHAATPHTPTTTSVWLQPDAQANAVLDWLNKIAIPMLDPQSSPLMLSRHNETDGLFPLEKNGVIEREVPPEGIASLVALPLKIDEQPVGVLCILFHQPQSFDAPDKLLINGLGHYTALAIINNQAFETLLQRRTRELLALQMIDQELDKELELDAILDTLLRLACEFVRAEGASILLYNLKTQKLITKVAKGSHEEARRALLPSPQDPRGITWWVLQNKKAVRVANVHSDPRWSDVYAQGAPDTVSELDIPLLDGEEAVGVLNFESSKEGAFHQEDQDFLTTLAGQAVLAIKKAQAYEREKHLAAERQLLNQVSRQITSQLELQQVFDLILEQALSLTHSHTGVLMLHDQERNMMWMAAERGVAPGKKLASHTLDEGVVGYVARTKEIQNIDPSVPPWDEHFLDYIPGTRSELAVPMLEGDAVKGVLNIESTRADAFDESATRLLKGLAELAVVALRNADLYKKAEDETQHFQILYQVSRELGEINEMEQLDQGYEVVVRLAEHYSHSRVVLRRYDEVTDDLELIRSSKHPHELAARIGSHEGINGYVTQTRQTVVIHNTDHLPEGIDAVTDRTLRSMIVIPIRFKHRYYGTLGLNSEEEGFFHGSDVQFYEGLAQQLASTIYRLEAAQRARIAEEVSLIGQIALDLTHRLGNDLGLVETYVNDVRRKLLGHKVSDTHIDRKLNNIVKSVRTVLELSRELKKIIANEASDRVRLAPQILLETSLAAFDLPDNIEVEKNVDDDVYHVWIFVQLVADILHNLIANARDAMPGGGTLSLRMYNAGNQVAIEIKDTGVGIPRQNMTKIFHLFYSTKGSSGFGLWSAHRSAWRNGGDLRVESELGCGTTFTLLLPKANDENNP